ncbi:phenylacetate--CoA ligase [Pseudoramibacter faecis]|uniref:phenylacetate--CoA ligase family protein n=1 Tax=Pseudoramibacter faecis TaxID=3108534 RepID=UPI002E775570|nr:phenylacetate--CoA ligase [Pseudoramibacter sp. HA2172]
MKYWNETFERMPREQLRALQLDRLKKTVDKVYARVPFYREKLQALGVGPESINSLEDIRRLPFTTKEDLRNGYPYDMLAEPLSQIARVQASSGTTGKPVCDGYTHNDLAMWAECVARGLTGAGADEHAVIHNAYGYGLFTGGIGIHGGAERMGASVIPMSSGNTARQIMLMQDFKATHLTCTPSYASYLGEVFRDAGIDTAALPLKAGIFGAEPWSENMRKTIEESLAIKAFDIYGMCEICGPGVAIECEEQDGLHFWEDFFYFEIVDPNTGEPVPDGEEGELVITTLAKEGMPLLRYRTHDLTHIVDEPCRCGRTHRRIARLSGRTDDMMVIRGVNVFPTQIESALLDTGDVEPHYQLIVRREGALDTLEIKVELKEDTDINSVTELEAMKAKIADRVKSIIQIKSKITLVEPKSIARSEGKAKRVIDLRKI